MKGLREFEIPFIGLKVGIHKFEYDIDKKFFDHFEASPIHDCKVHVRLEFEKKETFFTLNFFIDGSIKAECDRCLEPFNKEIFGDFTCYIKITEDPSKITDQDEVIYIGRDETIIDVSQLIYEYINLCLPMQNLGCEKPGEEPQCNKEVLKYIVNSGQAEKKQDEIDPRWAVLKNIGKQ